MAQSPRKAVWPGAWASAASLILLKTGSVIVASAVYPPARLAGIIRDHTPADLATRSIELAVKIANRLRIGFLEHAALAGLAIFAHMLWIAAGIAGAALVAAGQTDKSKARRALASGFVFFAAAALLGATSELGSSGIAFALYAAAAWAYATLGSRVKLSEAFSPQVRPDEAPLDAIRRSRRRFLRRAAGAAAALAGGGLLARRLSKGGKTDVPIASADERFKKPPGDPGFAAVVGLTPEITSTENFYNVDIDIVKPVVDHTRWNLKIGGLVEHPYHLDYRHLQSDFSVVEMASTLSCISNEVGGDLVSTAVWRGVRLADVLTRAGVGAGAIDVILRAADGYSDSIPIAKAMRPDTLIAFGMNGESLPRTNGFPARMVLPGIYGMKNVKWLTSIEVSPSNYVGYWQERGWSDSARVKTQSRIDVPAEGSTVAAGTKAAGVAWAGDRGISKVEISLDSGATWAPAALKRELAPNAWRLWSAELPAAKGRHRLKVRATDGAGRVQDAFPTRTHPNGASGLDSAVVTIKDG